MGCPCTPELLCKAAGQARWDVKGCQDGQGTLLYAKLPHWDWKYTLG